MASNGFIHLRVHSAYSLAEGAIRVSEEKGKSPRQDLIKLCTKNDMPAVALTDISNMFGAMEFSTYISKAGVQPIIGCEIFIARTGRMTPPMTREDVDRLVLLVQNELGYRNLSALLTQAYLVTDRAFPYVTAEELAQYAGGLLALSANISGQVGRLLLDGQKPAAIEALKFLSDLFPNRFYVELCRHAGGSVSQQEQQIENDLIDLAYQFNLPLVATNDVYFGDEGMYQAHDALLCISEKKLIADDNRRHLTPHHYFKSAAEMRTLFADLPEACDNTLVIAKRCAYMPPSRPPLLPAFTTADNPNLDEASELRRQSENGLKARLEAAGITDTKKYEDRLNFELNTIHTMGFDGYFLIVSDFIKWAKKNNIPVGPGRGSGAGSVVAWSLLITDLDPIRFNLLFERFLNPERVSMPDFDVDFCQGRREEVITYVQTKYGANKVGQIITFGKLQARAVLRDVGRVLGMSYGHVDKICKLVPSNPANPVTLQEAIDGEPQLQAMRDEDPTVAQLMHLATKLEGLYRNASTHAAGVVIGDRPLVELVPLYRDPAATLPATQFNMKTVESTGLVKFDFLGLKTLDVLQQCVDFLKAKGIDIDLTQLPLDDQKTYAMLSKGDTTGVFQLESSGMRDVLRRLKPNRFEDIIALVALYRPGPMDNIPKYIKCKNGEEEVDYLHPLLRPILEDTFGILIYQEQVMQSAQILAGYSLGGADLLRRAMGKKKVEEMAAQRATFVEGAGKNNITPDQASLIFDQIDKFAGYGFNKSHAAAYALIAYQTGYLKANYPVEFFAAAMNFERGDTDKLNIFRQELTRNGIALLAPDVNKSQMEFSTEETPNGKGAIRYALAAIKGVGDIAMNSLVDQRQTKGAYKDLFDFAERIDSHAINKKQFEGLVMAGAFDCLNKNRAQVLASCDLLLRLSHEAAHERSSGQANIFSALEETVTRPALPKVKAWDDLTRLQYEFQSLGFYLSAHPLDNYKALLERLTVVPAALVASKRRALGPSRFKLAGILLNKQERTAKSGNRFAFVLFSDTSGSFEVTVFSELLAAKRDMLIPGTAILVEADAQGGVNEGEELRFIARSFDTLQDVAAKNARGIQVNVFDADHVKEIQACLNAAPKGKGKVTLRLDLDDTTADLEIPGAYLLTEQVKSTLRQIGNGLDVQEY